MMNEGQKFLQPNPQQQQQRQLPQTMELGRVILT
jgi:hypothetical protein